LKIRKEDIEYIGYLSPMQNGMLFHDLMDGDSTTYYNQVTFEIYGELDHYIFKESYQLLSDCHQVFRTVFLYEKLKKPVQVILKKVVQKIGYSDVSALSEEEQNKLISDYIANDRKRGIDLENETAMRIHIFKKADDFHKVVWGCHHIILDGWCMSIIVKELFEAYDAIKDARVYEINEEPYSRYLEWLKTRDYSLTESYWQNYLKDIPENFDFPYKSQREKGYCSEIHTFEVEVKDFNRLKAIAANEKVTVNAVVQTLWGIMLSKYSNGRSAVWGNVTSGRSMNLAGIQQMIGVFINTMPLKLNYEPNDRIKDLLKRVNNDIFRAEENSAIMLSQVKKNNYGKTNHFSHIIAYENLSITDMLNGVKLGEFQLENPQFYEHTNYDLAVKFEPINALQVNLEYNASVFDRQTIDDIEKHFSALVKCFINEPELPIRKIDFSYPEEREYLLKTLNASYEEVEKYKTVQKVFAENVKKYADKPAIEYKDEIVTYKELDIKSNCLAGNLIRCGVKQQDIVAVAVEHTPKMIICILGIMKAGAVYLPIDESLPENRFSYIMRDCDVKFVISSRPEKYSEYPKTMLIDVRENLEAENMDEYSISVPYSPEDIQYIIYTSGSTGQPKGVEISNKALYRFATENSVMRAVEMDRIAQLASFLFDGSIYEVFQALLNGATLVIAFEEEKADTQALAEFLVKRKITNCLLTAQLFNIITDFDISCFAGLRILATGGEAASVSHIKKAVEKLGSNVVINAYGPTETTVVASGYLVQEVKKEWRSIPIGKPCASKKYYVLDEDRHLLPMGMPGELYIGGDGIAKGYHHNKKLTASKFIKNPYDPYESLYATGDIVRLMPDGVVDFIGRVDEQVKIRGYRIETGEILHYLLSHQLIKEGVVTVGKNQQGTASVFAYIVSDQVLNECEIKDFLRQQLPDYMVPARIIQIEAIPLNRNGKFDKKMLLPVEVEIKEQRYAAAENHIQEVMAEVWRQILNIDIIGIDDDFFKLGGDSIKAMQITAYLKKYGVVIEMKHIFAYSTIRKLSELAEYKPDKKNELVSGVVELTPIQRWFFNEKFEESWHFNQAVLLKAKEQIDRTILEQTMETLIGQHDALRMQYKKTDDSIVQINRDESAKSYKIQLYNISKEGERKEQLEKISEELQSGLNLEAGHLINVGLIREDTEDYILLVIHHLVVDGISWRIILSDMIKTYSRLKENNKPSLGVKTDSFLTYAKNLKMAVNEAEKKAYIWEKLIDGQMDSILENSVHCSYKALESKRISFQLSREQTKELLKMRNREEDADISDILISALAVTLKKWKKIRSFCVNLEYHGRQSELLKNDVSGTVGWFTSMYPLPICTDGADCISDIIKSVSSKNHYFRKHSVEYGILKYMSEEYSHMPQFSIKPEISLNYLGVFDKELDNDMFQVSFLNSGSLTSIKQHKCYAIDINAAVATNQLMITIDYNGCEFTKVVMEQFEMQFMQELSSYIAENPVEEIAATLVSTAAINDKYEPFPLSSVQMAYFLGKQDFYELGGFTTHNYIEFETEIDIDRMNMALNKIIQNQDMLRAVINTDGTQKILKEVAPYEIQITDIRGMSENEQNEMIENERKRCSHAIFDITTYPLFEIKGFLLSDTKKYLFISYDLMILDSASANIFIRNLAYLYQNPKEELHEMEYSYRDFIMNLQKVKQGSMYDESKKYWNEKLINFPDAPELPQIADPMKVKNGKFVRISESLSRFQYNRMKEFAKKNKTTPSAVLLTIYGEMLAYYSGQQQFAINLTVFNRYPFHEDIERMLGDFTSTILLDFDMAEVNDFWTKSRLMQKKLADALEYRYYDGIEFTRDVARKYGYPKGKAVMPIVFTSLLFEEDVQNEVDYLGKVKWAIGQTPQVYIDFQVLVENGTLKIQMDWVNELFEETMMQEAFGMFIKMLKDISENGQENELTLSDEEESLRLEYNDTDEIILPATLSGLFREQVERTPHNIAVKCNGRTMTYEELAKRSEQVANYLLENNMENNEAVAVLAERNEYTIVNIMGILKAGGTYVPIDPAYPKERVAYIKENSGYKRMLTANFYSEQGLSDYPASKVKAQPEPEATAYIIYTSGSTGKPKGVAISHESAANTIIDINQKFKVSSEDKIIGLSSMCFDLSVYDIFGALASGAQLVMVQDIHNTSEMVSTVHKEEITIWNSVPQLLQMYLNEASFQKKKVDCKQTLRLVMLSGDWIPIALPEQIKQEFNEAEVISLGGATEASIWSIYFPIEKIEPNWKSVPYGMPLANQKIYVLDSRMRDCPVNVRGEIYIGGTGLAQCYVGNSKLTEQSFLLHPKYGRVYKTGDYGIFHKEGYVEFIGRIDSQVKLRGYRIELGEIESIINEYHGIHEAVVTVQEKSKGAKSLVAYVVPIESIDVENLKNFIGDRVAEYMIPSEIVFLDKLPLTANGKVDRKRLPAVERKHNRDKQIQPRTDTEKKLAKIWKQVLGTDSVSLEDEFFEVGGDSLKAMNLVSRIRSELNINQIQLVDILRNATISKMAKILDLKGTAANCKLLRKGSSPDKNIFFIHGGNGNSNAYEFLISHIDSAYNCYGFDLCEPIGLQPQTFSISRLAEEYIKEIMKFNMDEREYLLAGWCIGGEIAFDIAGKLEKLGKKNIKVFMIDTPAPGHGEEPKFSVETEMEYISHWFKEEKLNFSGQARNLEELWKVAVSFAKSEEKVLEKMRRIFVEQSPDAVLETEQMSVEALIMLSNLFRSFHYATDHFCPEKVEDTEVIHICAQDRSEHEVEQWSQYCKKAPRSYMAKGNHFTMLQQKGGKQCAQLINEVVKRVEEH
jgi:amino acid adenylation domain-containing protein/non-ribosomal peptide synthase protein (TIGR01720 family)